MHRTYWHRHGGRNIGGGATSTTPQSLVESVKAAEDRISGTVSAERSARPSALPDNTYGEGFVKGLRAEARGVVVNTAAGDLVMTGPGQDAFAQAGGDYWVSGDRVLGVHRDRTVSGYAVMAGNTDRATWRFSMPDSTSLKVNDGGGVSLLIKDTSAGQDNAATLEVRDFINAPWVIDREGNKVPTRYQVEGNSITQVIERQGNDSEMVADPKLTYGRGVYLNMWGWEAEAFGRALGAGGIVGWWSVCNVVNKVGAWGRAANLVCYAAPGVSVDTLRNLLRLPPRRNLSWCYQTRILPSGGTMYPVNHVGNCT